jgi:FkbM family methyltransferase
MSCPHQKSAPPRLPLGRKTATRLHLKHFYNHANVNLLHSSHVFYWQGSTGSAASARGGRLMIDSGLVFDVGANSGQDTAAFLARGLRVVAIEANLKLCAEMQKRFAAEINAGRLVIVGKAISGLRTVILHLNSADSCWGAASASYAARGQAVAGKIERIEVETTTLTEIIRTHGSPRYLKVDIEGPDILCLLGLFHVDPPPFISIERPASMGEQRFAFGLLRKLGYTRFQIVDETQAPEQRHPTLAFRRGDIGLFGAELREGAWMGIARASAANCWIVLRSGFVCRIPGLRRFALEGRAFHIHARGRQMVAPCSGAPPIRSTARSSQRGRRE